MKIELNFEKILPSTRFEPQTYTVEARDASHWTTPLTPKLLFINSIRIIHFKIENEEQVLN